MLQIVLLHTYITQIQLLPNIDPSVCIHISRVPIQACSLVIVTQQSPFNAHHILDLDRCGYPNSGCYFPHTKHVVQSHIRTGSRSLSSWPRDIYQSCMEILVLPIPPKLIKISVMKIKYRIYKPLAESKNVSKNRNLDLQGSQTNQSSGLQCLRGQHHADQGAPSCSGDLLAPAGTTQTLVET